MSLDNQRQFAGLNSEQEQIRQLVSTNPHQMSEAEYLKIFGTVKARSPCRLLVFGVGNDTPLWCQANLNGTTVFVENSVEWIEKVTSQLNGLKVDIRHCTYVSRAGDFWSLIFTPKRYRKMPEWLEKTRWDVVIIDGPTGFRPEHPGRLQPICWVAKLASRSPNAVDVFVHDSDRSMERLAGLRFFGKSRLSGVTGRLAHYTVGNQSGLQHCYDIGVFVSTILWKAMRRIVNGYLPRNS